MQNLHFKWRNILELWISLLGRVAPLSVYAFILKGKFNGEKQRDESSCDAVGALKKKKRITVL